MTSMFTSGIDSVAFRNNYPGEVDHASQSLLRLRDLSKSYSGFHMQGISFCIPKGSVTGLIGSNGAGKTTIIKSILGLIHPDAGSIELLGENIFSGHAGLQTEYAIERVGVSFDSVAFPGEISVSDAQKIMSIANKRFDKTTFDRYCMRFNLDSEKKIKDLSRGMGMKLSLAAAFSISPELLILDEPTAGLDPMAREEILNILSDYVDSNTGILISSHITSDLEKIADEVVCIDDGKLVFHETVSHILSETKLAYCNKNELEHIKSHALALPDGIRYVKHGLGYKLLLPRQDEFHKLFPEAATGHMALDDYMSLMLKGEKL